MRKAEGLDRTCAILGFVDAENRTAIRRATINQWTAEGLVEYLGAADDVRTHIAAADCIVLPSYREGTPRTLLEAAAMVKPIIATDVPGCRGVVDHGQNGLLCQVKDANDLAQRMIELVAMPLSQRESMGIAGRSKVEREFDEKIVIERYLEAIAQLLEPSLGGSETSDVRATNERHYSSKRGRQGT